MRTEREIIDQYSTELTATIAAVTAERDELRRKLHIEELKNRHSLANNLCPDHRDKQAGKPCLACSIETDRRLLGEHQVEISRLLTALEMVRDLDAHHHDGHQFPADVKHPSEVAIQALAGHKTNSQKRWEWQGEAIQAEKQRADAAEAKLKALEVEIREESQSCDLYAGEAIRTQEQLAELEAKLRAVRELVAPFIDPQSYHGVRNQSTIDWKLEGFGLSPLGTALLAIADAVKP